jgi:hypothetical protein
MKKTIIDIPVKLTRISENDPRKMVFDIDYLNDKEISMKKTKLAIKKHTKFSTLMEEIIGTVHSLPDLFIDQNLKNFEIYVGICSYDENDEVESFKYLSNRFKDHQRTKEHGFGIVIGAVDSEKVKDYEATAIKFFKKIKLNNKLCVYDAVNIDSSKRGANTKTADALVYMTFRVIHNNEHINPIPRSLVEGLAEDLSMEEGVNVSAGQILSGVETLINTSNKINIRWSRTAKENFAKD